LPAYETGPRAVRGLKGRRWLPPQERMEIQELMDIMYNAGFVEGFEGR
jgi:hypothetical protein